MRNGIDIDVVLDEKYENPKVTIHAKEKNEQVERIIEAIENAVSVENQPVPVFTGDNVEFIPQRDIVRVYTLGRKIVVENDNESYFANRTLTGMEKILSSKCFIRISQSEIINIYKVKKFELSNSGTIGVEFYNGKKTWVSRSRVKAIKELIKGNI